MELSEKPFDTLVVERHQPIVSTTLFITVSPNPRTSVKFIARGPNGKVKEMKRPYGTMRQIHQYQYCIDVLKKDYISSLSSDAHIVGVAELNEQGNVHLHFIVNDPMIQNEVQLQCFRREILNSPRTQQNIIKTKVNARDWMNNIVYVTKTKSDIIEYCMKQQNQMLPVFKNYFI